MAIAILLYSILPGIVATASAKELATLPKNNISTSCTLASYTLLSSLKTARLTTNSNGSSLFVPAVFTSAKEPNGSLTASIGIGVADPNEPEESITPEPTLTPEIMISPTTIEQNVAAQSSAGGLNAEVLFAMVNEHRASMGLPAFQKDANVCSIAGSRAPELHNEIYVTHNMHAGFRARQLPYWATENMISQKTEADALNWWLHSPVHRSAIEGNYTHACTACQGDSCNMIFTSFVAKG